MSFSAIETQESVTLEPAAPANACVIWLHGLGADGHDFVPIVDELGLPPDTNVRFVFPHAPMRPVTINNGFVMRAWYDIKGFGPGSAEDAAGIRESIASVGQLIAAENARGIASDRIVLAGFSQGGAIALSAGLRHADRLAAIMALSTYLPLRSTLATEASAANRATPILMCHGERDPIVPLERGIASRDALSDLGFEVEWHAYRMEHSVSIEEIGEIGRWLKRVLALG